MNIFSPEKQLLQRIKNNEHNPICRQVTLQVVNCLCFKVDLEKILSSATTQSPTKNKRHRPSNIHWSSFNCGAKNRATTSDLKSVTCGHCQKSKDFKIMEKIHDQS